MPRAGTGDRVGEPPTLTSDRLSYFKRRAEEARLRARDTDDPRVRAVHLELAEQYATRAAALAARPDDADEDDDA